MTKQISRFVVLMFVMTITLFTLSACKKEVTGIAADLSTTPEYVYLNSDPSFNDVKVYELLGDDKGDAIDHAKLTFTVDTTKTGAATVMVTYHTEDATFNDSFTTEVINEEDGEYKLIGDFSSAINVAFQGVLESLPTEGEVDKTFDIKNNTALAGDDNYFDLQLSGKGYDANVESVLDADLVPSKAIDVELKIEQVLAGATETADAANFDQNTNLTSGQIDFSADAVGKTFKITATAKNIDTNYADAIAPAVVTVKVVDGYNVYNGNDLSVVQDNNSRSSNNNAWNEWKAGTIYEGVRPNSIVLQKNINLTTDNMPASFFYSEQDIANATGDLAQAEQDAKNSSIQTLVGSMNTNVGAIYKNYLNNDTFTIYGNYFQINTKQLPQVLWRNDGGVKVVSDIVDGKYYSLGVESVTGLFEFEDDGNVSSLNEHIFVQDLAYNGNGARGESNLNSGGLIFYKTHEANSTISNSVITDAYESFSLEFGHNEVENTTLNKFTNVKAYNSYSSILYIDKVNVLAIDSIFSQSGGPAIIALTNHTSDADLAEVPGNATTIDVVNTIVESYVNGEEPWFVQKGASVLVQGLMVADGGQGGDSQLIAKNQSGIANKTIITEIAKDNSNNSIMGISIPVVFLPGSSLPSSPERMEGTYSVWNTLEQYENRNVEGAVLPHALNVTSTGLMGTSVAIETTLAESHTTGENVLTGPIDCSNTQFLNVYIEMGLAIAVEVFDK